MTEAPKYILTSEQTMQDLARRLSRSIEKTSEEFVRLSLIKCTGENFKPFPLARILRTTFDEAIYRLPQWWHDGERLQRALSNTKDINHTATYENFENLLNLVDIVLHNEQMQNPEVRKIFPSDFPNSIIAETHVVDSMINFALFKEVKTQQPCPLAWDCLRTYCSLRLYEIGEPISDRTKARIASVAHDEKSVNAEMACDLLRAIQSGTLRTAPATGPAFNKG